MMLKSLKHISPKTKILFVVFILILLPSAILSYLGLQTIDQNAENLRTKYLGTISLVRDKLEREVIQLEENLRNSLIELFPELDREAELKTWLRTIESENPALKHPFLVNADGGLISTSVSLGWKKSRKIQTFRNPQMTDNFNMAEKAEFIRKDFVDAIAFYRKALVYTTSSQEHPLLLSRIGRCYFKMGKFKEGINEYKKILRLGNEEVTIGKVPASIVALSQIADGYGVMNASKEQYNVMLELYQRLLDHPWDLSGGDYLYYLKSTNTEIQIFSPPGFNINSTERNIRELMNREGKLLEQIRFITYIHKNIVHEIESNLKSGTVAELHPQHISWQENNSD
jgi:tetratricopeptide (TPR) repeat protein